MTNSKVRISQRAIPLRFQKQGLEFPRMGSRSLGMEVRDIPNMGVESLGMGELGPSRD